jgi:hypothetical protein
MKLRQIAPFLLCFLVCSCSDSPNDSEHADGIRITVDNQVSEHIEITSITSTDDGERNAHEIQAALKNTSATDGRWLDSNGGANGGSQRLLTLAPGQSQSVFDGTRAGHVTQYELKLITTEKSQDQLLTETLASGLPIAPGQGMAYSSTPASEKIPVYSVRGVANGLPFDAKTIVFRTNEKGDWSMEITDRSFDPVKGPAHARLDHPDVQTIYIHLPDAPAVGKEFQQQMKYGGGMFQIKPRPDSESTTSWNTSLAYKILITDWQKGVTTGNWVKPPDSFISVSRVLKTR